MLQIPAGRIFRPTFPLLTFSARRKGAPCIGDKRCFECRLLSETQFKCYVAFWKKADVSKGRKRSKSSGGSEEKRQLLGGLAG